MPKWLSTTVLREWKKPFSKHHARPRISFVWRQHHYEFLGEILARGPNAIRSTVELNADFNKFPRWPYQLAHFARMIGCLGWNTVQQSGSGSMESSKVPI